MTWLRGFGGGVLLVLGILWIAQGLNIVRGSGMSGHGIFAILGLAAAIVGVALLWSLTRTSGAVGARRS